MNKKAYLIIALILGGSLYSTFAYSRQVNEQVKNQNSAAVSEYSGVTVPSSTIMGTGGGVLQQEQLDKFKSEVSRVLEAKPGSVKNVSGSYILAGTLTQIDKIETDLGVGYEFTLKDVAGNLTKESVSATEARYMAFFNETLDLSAKIKTLKTIDDVKVGDYIAIRRNFNFLNPNEVTIQFVLVRSGK